MYEFLVGIIPLLSVVVTPCTGTVQQDTFAQEPIAICKEFSFEQKVQKLFYHVGAYTWEHKLSPVTIAQFKKLHSPADMTPVDVEFAEVFATAAWDAWKWVPRPMDEDYDKYHLIMETVKHLSVTK